MTEAMSNWYQPITFVLITKETINFQVVETRAEIMFNGVVESITPTALMIKPEGQRNWNYINVWVSGSIDLKNDDQFLYQSKVYRVTMENDWSPYGYQQFECVEDYTNK
jgi:hypothetical protein